MWVRDNERGKDIPPALDGNDMSTKYFKSFEFLSFVFFAGVLVVLPHITFAGTGVEGDGCTSYFDCLPGLQCDYVGETPPQYVCASATLTAGPCSASPKPALRGSPVTFNVDYSGGVARRTPPPQYWFEWRDREGVFSTLRNPTKTYGASAVLSPQTQGVRVTVWYGPSAGSGTPASCSFVPDLTIITLTNGISCSPTGDNLNCDSGWCSPSANTCQPRPTQCSDTDDNDSDGLTDYPQDSGCDNATDNTEGLNKTSTASNIYACSGGSVSPANSFCQSNNCFNNACRPTGYNCTDDTDCTGGQICNASNQCVAPPNPAITLFDADPNPFPATASSIVVNWQTSNASGGCTGSGGPWDPSASLSANGNDTFPSSSFALPFILTLTCNGAPGTTPATKLITISAVVVPPPSAPTITLCRVSPSCIQPSVVASVQATVKDGSAPLVYEWKDNGTVVSGLTGSSISPSPSNTGTHTYSVKFTDSLGRPSSRTCTPNLTVANDCTNVCTPACTGGQTCVGGVCIEGPGNPTNCPAGQICNTLGTTDIMVFLKKALLALVNLLIPIIVLFYIIVGLMFITARGAPEKLKVAKTAFLYVTIGSAVVLGAWALAEMIQTTIQTVQS